MPGEKYRNNERETAACIAAASHSLLVAVLLHPWVRGIRPAICPLRRKPIIKLDFQVAFYRVLRWGADGDKQRAIRKASAFGRKTFIVRLQGRAAGTSESSR